MSNAESLLFGRGMEDSQTDVIYHSMLLNFKNSNTPFPEHGKILEVGSGNGNFLNYLRKKGLDIEGIDTDPRDAGVLKADAKDLPYEDGSFDLIISKQVFDGALYDQHLEDQRKMLNEIARVLKKDGFYYAIEMFFEPLEGLDPVSNQSGNSVGTIYKKI